MDKAELQNKIRSRRSHHKSRLGCKNCKKRRVKCDEKRPACTNCLHHSVDCDYSALLLASSPASVQSPPAAPARRYRFKKSKYQDITCSSPDEEAVKGFTSTGIQCNLTASHHASGGISFSDLRLFHHFTTSTYRTLVYEPEDKNQIWQIHVPQWGISFPSIHHLTLAISALHLGYLQPDQRDQYVIQADDHFTFGVQSVSTVLSRLDESNCQMVYLSAVMICFVYFARGPIPGEYLVFSAEGKSEWLVLMRGVRYIMSTQHQKIFTGLLKPQHTENVPDPSPSLREEHMRHIPHLETIRQLVETHITTPDRDLYLSAIQDLIGAFEEVYKLTSTEKVGISLMPAVIGWIYRLKEEFVGRLEDKDSFALIILAYWCILLRYMRVSWLMRGWDEHVMSGIRASLREDYHRWIDWPVGIICT